MTANQHSYTGHAVGNLVSREENMDIVGGNPSCTGGGNSCHYQPHGRKPILLKTLGQKVQFGFLSIIGGGLSFTTYNICHRTNE